MKNLIVAAAVVISMTALGGDKGKPPETHVLPTEVQYTQPFGPQGPNFGFVEGKMGDNKPASFFVKFPAGGDSGWHTHDHDYQAVVIQGTFTEQQQGDAAETQLPAGSYFTQTAKVNHRNGCVKGGTDCVLFVHFPKGANSRPLTPEGKPVAQAQK